MSEDKITGTNSYRICPRCGNYVYFMNRPRQEPNLLQKNYEADNNTSRKTDEKTIVCEKCGEIIPLC